MRRRKAQEQHTTEYHVCHPWLRRLDLLHQVHTDRVHVGPTFHVWRWSATMGRPLRTLSRSINNAHVVTLISSSQLTSLRQKNLVRSFVWDWWAVNKEIIWKPSQDHFKVMYLPIVTQHAHAPAAAHRTQAPAHTRTHTCARAHARTRTRTRTRIHRQ